MKRVLLAVILASLAWAAQSALADVTVSSAWVRPTAPGQSVAGAYLKITSTVPASLIAVSSTAAKSVEVHEMSMADNVMKMRQVAKLELPAGKTVELKPGGYHLMLIDVAKPLAKGASVPLKLTIEDKGGKRHTVDVKAAVGDGAAAAHGAR
jgi:periplasmic copper chaperone A